jgi:hypothetical protein
MKSRPGWWNVVDMRRLGPIESPEVQATHERLMALVIERQAKGTIHIVANSLSPCRCAAWAATAAWSRTT